MDFVQIKAIKNDPKTAYFEKLEGMERDNELKDGVPLLADMGKDARFRMSDDFPRQIAARDFVPNHNGVLVMSAKARALLEKEGVEDVEYLPVQLLNHKGRKVPEDYFILNPVRLVDCADAKKSKFKVNGIDKYTWNYVEKLTIDEKKIPKDAKLVSVAHLSPLILIHRALAKKMTAAGLTGFQVIELDKYRWP